MTDSQHAEDLAYLTTRLARAFARRPVMPLPALLYRLAEAGPQRFDARWLAHAIPLLAGTGGYLAEPARHLYAPAPADADTALAATATVRRLGEIGAGPALEALTEVAGDVLRSRGGHARLGAPLASASAPSRTAVSASIPRLNAVLEHAPRRGRPVVLWLGHELPCLAPDDPRLWELLARVRLTDARLVIVARAIAPATFPVLQAVGAAALQTWSWHVPLTTAPELDAAADAIGWPPVRDTATTAAHPIWGQLAARLDEPRRGKGATNAADAALDAALARAVPPVDGGPAALTATALAAWARDLALPVPAVWYAVVGCWAAIARATLPPAPVPAHERRGTASAPTAEARPLPDLVESAPDASPADSPSATVDTQPRERTTVVMRGRVAAEVDRQTWDELLERHGGPGRGDDASRDH